LKKKRERGEPDQFPRKKKNTLLPTIGEGRRKAEGPYRGWKRGEMRNLGGAGVSGGENAQSATGTNFPVRVKRGAGGEGKGSKVHIGEEKDTPGRGGGGIRRLKNERNPGGGG